MITELGAGIATLGRGLGVLLRRPRLFGLGALPPLLITVVFVGLLVVLFTQLDKLAVALTPFADGWNATLVAAVRVTLGVALVVGSILLMIISFSTVTLALGSPLYDKIAEETEKDLGPVPNEVPEPLLRGAGRTVIQSAALILVSALGSVLIVVIGLVPVAGGVIGAVLSAVFGGWMLAIELVGSTLERRGLLRIADRRALLSTSRARVLGFAVPVFLLMAVPLLAVLVFPAATAGGTILARDLLARRNAASR
ncbi:MAG: EI24 domain-containing protein [Propionibacteriaceae bacterium]